MKRHTLVVLVMVLFASQGHCQGNRSPSDKDVSQQVASEVAVSAQTTVVEDDSSQETSIYGEIKSVNTATSSIVVQYYDYDNDKDKSVEITTDNNTKMEGGLTINDVNQGDWVDINYTVADGKNIAKSIEIEKEDAATE